MFLGPWLLLIEVWGGRTLEREMWEWKRKAPFKPGLVSGDRKLPGDREVTPCAGLLPPFPSLEEEAALSSATLAFILCITAARAPPGQAEGVGVPGHLQ